VKELTKELEGSLSDHTLSADEARLWMAVRI